MHASDDRALLPPGSTSRTLERLVERASCRDLQRLGLCSRLDLAAAAAAPPTATSVRRAADAPFRLSVANHAYAVCRRFALFCPPSPHPTSPCRPLSYPAVLAIPAKLNDVSLRKIAKGHKHGR